MKKTYTLHIGVDPLNLLAVLRRTDSPSYWHIDGDGWNTWGEAVGTDVNDRRTLHLSSKVPVTKADARHVLLELDDLLTVMTNQSPGNGGGIAVLTNVEDWSEDQLVLYRAVTHVVVPATTTFNQEI
jgi:hypothetical protein